MGAIEQFKPSNEQTPQTQTFAGLAVSLEDAKNSYGLIRQVTREVLQEGTDYDTIPGTQKPTLLKPGAENMLRFFGLGHRIELNESVKDWESGFFYFSYKVTVFKLIGEGEEFVLSECEGSANSKESRYADRWVPQWRLKDHGIDDPSGLESRDRENDRGPYKEYKVKNKDIFSLVNTLQKMAIKRALVGAALQATGASGLFTQDLEDMGEFVGSGNGSGGSGQQTNGRRNQQTNRGQQGRSKGTSQARTQKNGMNGKATGKQINAIVKIGQSKGIEKEDMEELVKGQVGVELEALDRKQASEMIKLLNSIEEDELQALVDSYVNPSSEVIDISDDELPF